MGPHRHLDAGALTAGLPREWAEDVRLALTVLQDALVPGDEQAPCVVCVGVAAVCDHAPVLLERIADLASGLARTLREAAPDETGERDHSDASDVTDNPRGTAPTRRPPPPTTVRIDVSD